MNMPTPDPSAETPAAASPAPSPAPSRGYRPPVASDPRRRSVALASILSAVPGLGQIYTGYYKHGFINAIVVVSLIALLNTRLPDPMYPLLAPFLFFFWLYNIVDAGRRAAFLNQAIDGSEPLDIPASFAMPGPGGSLAGGVVLILGGVILLANTAFGVSLDWLESWWPLAPILGGVYLAWRGIQERG